MNKTNCWEFMKCGNGPGSEGNNGRSRYCPVAREYSADGLNGGINGGRICWIVAGNNRNDPLGCSLSENISSCSSCMFHLKVKEEEGLRKVCRSVGAVFHRCNKKSQELS